jgi:hypothetical protein
MKYVFYLLLLCFGFAAGWYVYKPNPAEAVELEAEQKRLIDQNQILLIENIRLKKVIDKNLEVRITLEKNIDSLKIAQRNAQNKAANRIKHLSSATDAELLDIWARHTGEE